MANGMIADMMNFGGSIPTNRVTLQFPKDIGVGDEFLNHMSFEAMKVSGGVDTRSLKFAPATGLRGSFETTVVLPIPSGATQCCISTGMGTDRSRIYVEQLQQVLP